MTNEENKDTKKYNIEKSADHLDNKQLIEKITDENDDIFKELVYK